MDKFAQISEKSGMTPQRSPFPPEFTASELRKGCSARVNLVIRFSLQFLFLGYFGHPLLHAQRYSPVISDWKTLDPSHPLGALTSGEAPGLAPESTTDSGFFRYIEVEEGDEIKACLTTTSTDGVSGVMVRDSTDPSAPFVFGGIDSAGNWVMYWRHRSGEAIQAAAPTAAPAGTKWLRLLVGNDTVYFYDAAQVATAKPGPWNFRGAVKVELSDSGGETPGCDVGGYFISKGSTTVTDLFQTSLVIWSERTTRLDDLGYDDPENTPAGWEAVYVGEDEGQVAESTYLLARTATASGDYVDFPLDLLRTQDSNQNQISGTYGLFVHAVAGSPNPLQVQVVKDGNVETTHNLENAPTLPNTPTDLNRWLFVKDLTVADQSTYSIRIVDNGHSDPTHPDLFADAVRAILKPRNEINSPYLASWFKVPANQGGRTSILNQGDANNSITRTDVGLNGSWNAGGYGAAWLVGDGVFQMQFKGGGLRQQAGLTTSTGSANPDSIPYKFNSKNNGKVIAVGSGIEFPQNNAEFLEIERIGTRIFFRSGTVLRHETSASSAALAFATCLFDENAKTAAARIYGHAVGSNYVQNLDADSIPDGAPSDLIHYAIGNATTFNERWVIDANPNDRIQSIYDVFPEDDSDGDGLSDLTEFDRNPRTNPAKADTDSDGLTDGDEVNIYLTDPNKPDSDNDGLSDFIEALDAFGFLATDMDGDSDNDGVSDLTEYQIITNAITTQRADFQTQELVTGEDDYDGDGVIDLHESEDRTSAVDPDEYFLPVLFGPRQQLGNFGMVGGMGNLNHAVLEHLPFSVERDFLTTKIRWVSGSPAPGTKVGAYSHHYLKVGSRLRFQWVDTTKRGSVGFRFLQFDGNRVLTQPGDLPHYEVRIESTANTAQIYVQDGSVPAPAATFPVTSETTIEMTLEDNLDTQIQEIAVYADDGEGDFTEIYRYAFPSSIDLEEDPMVVAVNLDQVGAGIFNARYRNLANPDADGDLVRDLWEEEVISRYPGEYGSISDLYPGGDADSDDLLNGDEYSRGTFGYLPDSDTDGLNDGYEVLVGLDPLDPDDAGLDSDSDGIPDYWENYYGLDRNSADDFYSDSDGDGRNHLEEYLAATSPHDFFNGIIPSIEIVSGNHQKGFPGEVLSGEFVVRIIGEGGEPMANAPVRFETGLWDGLLHLVDWEGVTTQSKDLEVRTDSRGIARIFNSYPAAVRFRLSTINHFASEIQVTSGGATATMEATSDTDFPALFSPALEILSGDGQTGPPDSVAPIPLLLRVKSASGNPLPNIPVTFSISGSGELLVSGSEGLSSTTSLSFVSDALGIVRIHGGVPRSLRFRHPATNGTPTVLAEAPGASAISLQFYTGSSAAGDFGLIEGFQVLSQIKP